MNDRQTVAAAIEKVEAAAAKLDPKDIRLAQWRATLATYKAFFDGDWADIMFTEGFTGLADAPKWSRVDDHTLVTRGTYPLRLELIARLPAPIEVEFDINTLAMPPDVSAAGVQFGRVRPVPNTWRRGGFFGLNSKTKKAVVNRGTEFQYPATFKDTNRVRVLAWHGYREFYVNSALVSENTSDSFKPTSYFALGAPGAALSSPIVRFSNLRIRQIPFDPPPERDDPEETVTYYTRRIAWRPKQLEFYANRGEAYLALGKLDKAESDFQLVIANCQDGGYSDMMLGVIQSARGNYQQAIDQFQSVLKDHPKYPGALNQLAWLLATCGEKKFRNGALAVEYAKQAVEYSKWRPGLFRLTAAAAYAEHHNFAQARKLCEEGKRRLSSDSNLKPLFEAVKKALEEKRPFRQSDAPEAIREALKSRLSQFHQLQYPTKP